MGFLEDIELILEQTNDEKKMLFFSATMPKAIMDIAKFSMIGTKSEIMEKMNIKSIIHLSLENPNDSSKLPEKIRNIKENEYILPFDYSLDELLSYLKDNNIKYNMEQVLTPTLNDLFLILTGRKLRDE